MGSQLFYTTLNQKGLKAILNWPKKFYRKILKSKACLPEAKEKFMTEPKGLGKSLKAFEGKGLEAFFSNQKVSSRENSIQTVPIEKITMNRQQPRKEFNEETLKELAESIRKEGVLQPLVVSPLSDGRYELIAGERRLRASRLAGAEEVPVVIRNADQEKMLELALVENIQREDLNAIEEAICYQSL